MSDLSEDEFTPLVEQWLRRWWGDDAVHTSVTLDTGDRPDFMVKTPLHTLVVEVENDWASAANTQTAWYAAHNPDEFTGVTVLPSGHRDKKEFDVMVELHRSFGGYFVELDPDTVTATINSWPV